MELTQDEEVRFANPTLVAAHDHAHDPEGLREPAAALDVLRRR